MTALAWRQSRLAAAGTAAVLGLVALLLLLTGHQMTSYLHSSGLAACLAKPGDCSLPANQFTGRYGSLLGDVGWLTLVPMLAGGFWGAPLVAREIEQHTHRLVWTQSITRSRWLAVKLSMFLLATVLAAAALTALFTWWYKPFEQIDAGGAGNAYSRMNLNVFDFQGTVLTGYTVCAFALGVAAGAVLRRTIPAMAVTVTGFVALRLSVQSLRGRLLTPLRITYPLGGVDPRARLGDWTLSSGPIDAHGHSLTFAQLITTCPATTGSGVNRACLTAHGITAQDLYQPLTRFWELQGIETGIFLTAAAALLALATWWTLRRCS